MEVIKTAILGHLPHIMAGFIIILGFLCVSILIKKILSRFIPKLLREKGIDRLISGFLFYTILILGIFTGLNTMGVKIGPVIAGLGLGGFALGFALKDALSNVLAGIMIILYRPFKIGDYLLVSGCEGSICEINFRYTVLQHKDETFMIPNSVIFTTPLRIKFEEIKK